MASLPKQLGRYQIVGELGTGGMAEILLARLVGPSDFERPVVLKRILPHLARRESFVTMFLDEARIIARVRHRNVVQVQELVHEANELFMVMEYLEGESVSGLLKRLAKRIDPLDFALGAYIAAEACAGLHAAHEAVDAQGQLLALVHRDVSPQNLFVTYDGEVKVLDFGIVKASQRQTHTQSGMVRRGRLLDRGRHDPRRRGQTPLVRATAPAARRLECAGSSAPSSPICRAGGPCASRPTR